MAIKICLHERPDGKIDEYRIYSNQELSENIHRSRVLYQGWYLNQEQAQRYINWMIQDERCDFIHLEQDIIGDLICKSWIFFDKENPAKPSDFVSQKSKIHTLKISGGITKHLCGQSPDFIIAPGILSDDWTTFNSEGLKSKYRESVCPVCDNLHLKQGDSEILYGFCDK
jgi:hypothetical protein